MKFNSSSNSNRLSRLGLVLGPLIAVLLLLIGAPEQLVEPDKLLSKAWVTLALLALMAIWWVTEAIPIPVTSLLPLLVLPVFGVSSISQASAPYMHPIVVLLMGGFIFAKAIEHWGLHQRLALHVVKRMGGSPAGMIGGFMLAAALLSMWISNSATSIMMMPIAISVAATIEGESDTVNKPFTLALLLGIAYACSIGGLGTPIGTPTNLIVMGYLGDHRGQEVAFSQWMMIGIPTVLILLPLAWLVLTKWLFKLPATNADQARIEVSQTLNKMGRITAPERRVLVVFIVVASLWIFRRLINAWEWQIGGHTYLPFSGLTDHTIAILAVLLCFVIPAGQHNNNKRVDRLLNWKSAESIPWGVLLLFGGGMSLAQAISSTGLSAYVGSTLSAFASYPTFLLIFLVASVVLVLTEVTSNVATASALMPILGALAIETGMPIEIMAAPLALAASCAFMLPMATGPNAVVFSTDKVRLTDMARVGFRLNLVALVVISFVSYYLSQIALG